MGATIRSRTSRAVNVLTHVRRWAAAVLLSAALAHSAAAQIPTLNKAKGESPPQPLSDPMGRTTPPSTILAFTHTVERKDFVSAGRYMQLSASQRPGAESLARDLTALLDRYLSKSLTSIDNTPGGSLNDGLPIDRERVGPLIIGKQKTDLVLVRVTDPQVGPVWLISSDTLALVPALRGSITQSWIERVMPQALVNRDLFGISLAHWVVLAASLLIPFLLLTLISRVAIALASAILRDPAHRHGLQAWYVGIRSPFIVALTLAIQLTSMPTSDFR
jgi:MscS family membrane protein